MTAGSTPQPRQKKRRGPGRPFVKGQSGNPTGMSKASADVVAQAKALTPVAMATLGEIAADQTAPPAARVSASTALLDRAWGRPQQAVDMTTKGEKLTGYVLSAPPEIEDADDWATQHKPH